MDQQEFLNKYIENILAELNKEQKEKLLMKTQLVVANSRIEQLNKAVATLQQKCQQLESVAPKTDNSKSSQKQTQNSEHLNDEF